MSVPTASQLKEVEKATMAGESGRSIATRVGLSQSTIARHILDWRRATSGVAAAPRTLTPLQIAEIERRTLAGEPQKAIAESMGLSSGAVAGRVRKWRDASGIEFDRHSVKPAHAQSEETLAQIGEMVEAGASSRQIAEAIGCHKATARRHAAAYRQRVGKPPAPAEAAIPDALKGRIVELYRSGATLAQVGRDLSLSTSTVMKYVRRHRATHGDALPAGRPFSRRSPARVADVKRLALQGVRIPEIARTLEISNQAVWRAVGPVLGDIRAAGATCDCGAPYAHKGACLGHAGLGDQGLGSNSLAELQHLVASGGRFARIARELGVAQSTVAKHAHRILPDLIRAGVKCACGAPLGHLGGCSSRTPEERQRARQLAEADRRRSITLVSSQTAAQRRDALYAAIAAQVPRHITGALRDDVISDAYLALWDRAA